MFRELTRPMTEAERAEALDLAAHIRHHAFPPWWLRLFWAACSLTLGKAVTLLCCAAPIGWALGAFRIGSMWIEVALIGLCAVGAHWLITRGRRSAEHEHISLFNDAAADIEAGMVREYRYAVAGGWWVQMHHFVQGHRTGCRSVLLDLGGGRLAWTRSDADLVPPDWKFRIPVGDSALPTIPLTGTVVTLPGSRVMLRGSSTFGERVGARTWCIDEPPVPEWTEVPDEAFDSDARSQITAPIATREYTGSPIQVSKALRGDRSALELARQAIRAGMKIEGVLLAGGVFAWATSGIAVQDLLGMVLICSLIVLVPTALVALVLAGGRMAHMTLRSVLISPQPRHSTAPMLIEDRFTAEEWILFRDTENGPAHHAAARTGDVWYMLPIALLPPRVFEGFPGAEVRVVREEGLAGRVLQVRMEGATVVCRVVELRRQEQRPEFWRSVGRLT